MTSVWAYILSHEGIGPGMGTDIGACQPEPVEGGFDKLSLTSTKKEPAPWGTGPFNDGFSNL